MSVIPTPTSVSMLTTTSRLLREVVQDFRLIAQGILELGYSLQKRNLMSQVQFNLKELNLLTTELSGVLPKEKIREAYDYVMNKDPNNRHNFLFVDLTPKKHHPSPYRMNYTEWILEY